MMMTVTLDDGTDDDDEDSIVFETGNDARDALEDFE